MIGKEPRFWTVWFGVGDITRDNSGKASKAFYTVNLAIFSGNSFLRLSHACSGNRYVIQASRLF
jgi:hypothetical protein